MNKNLWQDLLVKVNFLQLASSSSIETHMSWVFLTDDYVYKLKKPIAFRHLKLDTIEARHASAQREVELNQRLAPGLYLGIIPLLQDKQGHFYLEHFSEKGEIVDWLVKMHRIPHKLILDNMIANRIQPGPQLLAAARFLAEFYITAPPATISPEDFHSKLKRYVEDNLESLSVNGYGLDQSLVITIHQAQLALLQDQRESFYQRVTMGKIIEGHGDLRPEHVCLTSPPMIIDRLDFSQELRILDPIDELVYFNLECTLLGTPEYGKIFFEAYQEMSRDSVSDKMILFYQSYRATLRAKLSVWHLDDPRVKDKAKWSKKSQEYLNLAKVILE